MTRVSTAVVLAYVAWAVPSVAQNNDAHEQRSFELRYTVDLLECPPRPLSDSELVGGALIRPFRFAGAFSGSGQVIVLAVNEVVIQLDVATGKIAPVSIESGATRYVHAAVSSAEHSVAVLSASGLFRIDIGGSAKEIGLTLPGSSAKWAAAGQGGLVAAWTHDSRNLWVADTADEHGAWTPLLGQGNVLWADTDGHTIWCARDAGHGQMSVCVKRPGKEVEVVASTERMARICAKRLADSDMIVAAGVGLRVIEATRELDGVKVERSTQDRVLAGLGIVDQNRAVAVTHDRMLLYERGPTWSVREEWVAPHSIQGFLWNGIQSHAVIVFADAGKVRLSLLHVRCK